jgi:hypothetical protein
MQGLYTSGYMLLIQPGSYPLWPAQHCTGPWHAYRPLDPHSCVVVLQVLLAQPSELHDIWCHHQVGVAAARCGRGYKAVIVQLVQRLN